MNIMMIIINIILLYYHIFSHLRLAFLRYFHQYAPPQIIPMSAFDLDLKFTEIFQPRFCFRPVLILRIVTS